LLESSRKTRTGYSTLHGDAEPVSLKPESVTLIRQADQSMTLLFGAPIF